MDITLGYLKDAIAFPSFLVLLYLTKYDMLQKSHFILLFTTGFIVDGIFTIIPELHNTKI